MEEEATFVFLIPLISDGMKEESSRNIYNFHSLMITLSYLLYFTHKMYLLVFQMTPNQNVCDSLHYFLTQLSF